MMIPPFTLPSKSSIKILMREATVSDLLDFADLDPDHEEEITTLFLNRLQDKGTFVDSLTWTAEDRRFGLFWYWLHTTDDCDVAITYQCGHCGKSHTFLQDYRKLAEGFTSMQGLPEREFDYSDTRYTVKPLTGEDVEQLEAMRMMGDSKSDQLKRKLERISRTASIPMEKVVGLSLKDYRSIEELIETALMDMQHGLEAEQADGKISLILPPHKCPNEKEAMTRVRVLFRTDDFIPAL